MFQKCLKKMFIPASLGLVLFPSISVSMENNNDRNLKVSAGIQLQINQVVPSNENANICGETSFNALPKEILEVIISESVPTYEEYKKNRSKRYLSLASEDDLYRDFNYNSEIEIKFLNKHFRTVCKELRNNFDSFGDTKRLTSHAYTLDDLSNSLYESNEWRIQRVKVEKLDNNSVLMLGKTLKLLNLPNLKDLCLHDCVFNKTIPDTFFQLRNLEKLEISSSDEKKAPTILNPLIVNLTNIKELNFSGHGYTSFQLPEVSSLPKLTSLDLSTRYEVFESSIFRAIDFDAFPNLRVLKLAPTNVQNHSSSIVNFMLDLQNHRHDHENLSHIKIVI